MAACTPVAASNPVGKGEVVSPLKWEVWLKALSGHPDRNFVAFIVDGLRYGFRIGFGYTSCSCRSAQRNMLSAYQHPEVIEEYLEEECRQGRVLGPFKAGEIPGLHISRFGVIPKPHKPGKWRLILDLSHPEGASVNDGIDPQLSTLSYVSVDDVAEAIVGLGRGALLAKVDVQSAYRVVPVHPEDRRLLGMRWQGRDFVDATLPFGLRSAPKIFTALADAVEWVLRKRGVQCVAHYLDDFIMVGPPASGLCQSYLDTVSATCKELELPLAADKQEGPTTCLEFLGIELDSAQLEMRLSPEKLGRLKELVAAWRGRKSCVKRELQSLVGSLQHACKVVRPGRSFMRRMHELLKRTKRESDHIRLNKEIRADIEWWHAFLGTWNGVSLLRGVRASSPDVDVWSDASGSWGCGAFWRSLWLQVPWVTGQPIAEASIAAKEFLPILLAGLVWGEMWRGCTVRCNCDNQAVVCIINQRYARDPVLAHMLRCLFFICALHQFEIVAEHTPGCENIAADAISRDNLPLFRAQVPNAASAPSTIPPISVAFLTSTEIDWLSQDWTSWFTFISTRL